MAKSSIDDLAGSMFSSHGTLDNGSKMQLLESFIGLGCDVEES